MEPTPKQERPCTYKRNFEARSSNTFCRGKAISITYSECMFVALCNPVFKTHALCYIVARGPSGFTIFLHIISYTALFKKERKKERKKIKHVFINLFIVKLQNYCRQHNNFHILILCFCYMFQLRRVIIRLKLKN